MGTTADKLNQLIGTKQAIREAIVSKGVSVSDQDTFISYASKIREIPQEGGSGGVNPSPSPSPFAKGDVTFYDYDGTILHSYTKEEFLSLSKMPELPTRTGLICQEWNWEYNTAMAYVEEYGVLDVSATYITDDGKTRLYITINAEGRTDVPIYFQQTAKRGVVVNWGDGSEAQTYSSTAVNATHHYDSIGDYVITLEVTSGELKLGGSATQCMMGSTSSGLISRAYHNMLKKVEIGNSMTSIGIYTFHSCYSLSSIVIPNSVTSIGDYAFYSCYSLPSIVIPNSVTSIGKNAFDGCNSLSSIVILNSVTSIGDNVFEGCCSLPSIVFPNSVTSIGKNALYGCYSLSSIVIPNSVTSIGGYAFYSCCSLPSIVIPNSVTSIDVYAFQYCVGVAFYDFSTHESVPTLANINAFTYIPNDCKIVVPDALYDAWIAATNWSSCAKFIIKSSEFNA